MLHTTQYSSQKYNLRFSIMGSQVKPSICHCEKPPKTNVEHQKLDGWGRCFSWDTRVYIFSKLQNVSFSGGVLHQGGVFGILHLCAAVAFKDLTDVRSICTREAWEGKPKKPTPERRVETFGHIFFGGWKLKIASDSFQFWNEGLFLKEMFFLRWSVTLICAYHGCLECPYCKLCSSQRDWVHPRQFLGLCFIQQNGWEYQLCLYIF